MALLVFCLFLTSARKILAIQLLGGPIYKYVEINWRVSLERKICTAVTYCMFVLWNSREFSRINC